MSTLRKRRAGIMSPEFIVTEAELALAFNVHSGSLEPERARRLLQDWRWTEADAAEFLEAVAEAGRRA